MHRLMPFIPATALSILLLAPHPQAAGQAHQHGMAQLDIAVEPRKITLRMHAPLDNFLGYERAPRTDAERKQADALVTRLRAADTLFKIDPAAQCAMAAVELSSSALKLGQPDAQALKEGHAEIEGTFEFGCADTARAGHIDIALFASFPRMQRLDVQVATSRGQFQRNLKRPATRIVLTK